MDEQQRLKIALRRYAAISGLVDAEIPPGGQAEVLRELGATHGHHPDTLWRWARRFRQGGLDGLKPPLRRADAGTLKALSPEILSEAVRLREEEPRRSTLTLIALLERLHPQWRGKIARPTLDRHLRRLGKTRKRLAHPSRVLRRFAKAARNDLWVADFCLPQLAFQQGEQQHRAILLAIIDHTTRYLPASAFVPTRQAVFVEDLLRRAIAHAGLPRAFFVDNGAELTGSLVAGGCTHLGIRHIRSSVGEPESRGVVERFFRTVQESFVPEMAAKAMLPTLEELNRYWDAWVEFYHGKPHAALEGKGPREAWESDPAPLRHVDPVTVDGAFLIREPRKVNKTSLVSWDGRPYLCADALVGERIEIRYHPARTEYLQIWKDGRFLQVAPRYYLPENVPHQSRPPHAPTPRENLLDLLDNERQQALVNQRAKLPQTAVITGGHPFTEALAAAVLEAALGRNLEARELEWLAESWRRAGGWQADLTERAITLYRNRFGPGRHLAYYLEFIVEAHLKARKQEGTARV